MRCLYTRCMLIMGRKTMAGCRAIDLHNSYENEIFCLKFNLFYFSLLPQDGTLLLRMSVLSSVRLKIYHDSTRKSNIESEDDNSDPDLTSRCFNEKYGTRIHSMPSHHLYPEKCLLESYWTRRFFSPLYLTSNIARQEGTLALAPAFTSTR